MKKRYFFLVAGLLISSRLMQCSKSIEEIRKPALFISFRDDSGKVAPGATVRLYKNLSDSGITRLSDSTGVVIFTELEETLYYWHAQKGCKTNRLSQVTLDRALIPNVILYGYSVLSETGVLQIINNTPEPYKVSDSLFNITLGKDTPYIAYRRTGSYILHSEKISTPGTGKDTSIRIRCGDTTTLRLPY